MRRRSQFLLLAALSALTARAQPPPAPAMPAPAVNWVLPLFSREGFRTMTLRGSEARPASGDRLSVTNFNATLFSGDAAARVTTVLLSSNAIFDPKAKRAAGDTSVRLIRDDLEATGTSWTYDDAQKRVTMAGDVRIVFNVETKDLLK